jgi:hypothetical protein
MAITIGPWRVGADVRGYNVTVWAAEPGVCITSVFDRSFGPDAPTLKQAVDNARLIAAAPDLLEALHRVNHTLSVHGKMNCDTDLHEVVRAAIAKATQP